MVLANLGGYRRFVNSRLVVEYRNTRDGTRSISYERQCGMFFSPFETLKPWRYYWKFMREYPGMVTRVEADCFAALCYDGLVTA